MDREEILETAKTELSNIYEGFKSTGLLSIYLWGSITTSDFDLIESDIDCIGIVANSANRASQALIINFLEQGKLKSHSPRMNYLYEDELDGGAIKSDLAKVIDPRLLVLDFPYWMYVAGKEFSQNDFKLPVITPKEAVEIRIGEINRRYLPLSGEPKDYKYFLKEIARVCYYLEHGDEIKAPFSYAGLSQNKNELTGKTVDAFLEIKASDWDKEVFEKRYEVFVELLNTLQS